MQGQFNLFLFRYLVYISTLFVVEIDEFLKLNPPTVPYIHVLLLLKIKTKEANSISYNSIHQFNTSAFSLLASATARGR